MNYLITGGSGFIGSHLIQKILENGHNVINIDNFDSFYDYKIKINNTLESLHLPLEFQFLERESDIIKLVSQTASDRYRLYYTDLRNIEGLKRIFSEHSIDFVIHLAALAGVRPSIENPLEYAEVNINGSLNLWEVCKEFQVKKFIFASSSSVYGNNKKIPFAETDSVDFPISPYAATKKSGEILGYTYHHLYSIDMIMLRFFTVYGPRQRPDLAIHKFFRLIQQNKEIPFYGDGTTARDYTYIDDIISGILGAIEYLSNHQNVFEIINLGENETITLNEMVNSLETSLEKTAIKNSQPMQPGDVQKTNADITKAQNLLGYSPKTNFQNGIKKFVEWFLKNGNHF